MTPEQLEKIARECLSEGLNITLVLPRPWKSRPPKFPRGELLCVNVDGDQSVSFKPEKILAWLKYTKLIVDTDS